MDNNVEKTSLYNWHREKSNNIVSFSGFLLPVYYSGIVDEHLSVRKSAGLFDVSHMGQIKVSSKRGDQVELAQCLEKLMPCDLSNLREGRQCYSFFTNEEGGLSDDLMVANLGDHFLLVVNASRKFNDVSHLNNKIGDKCNIKLLDDRALIALQGPLASSVLEGINILKSNYIQTPQLDTEILMAKVLGSNRAYVILNDQKDLNDDNLEYFKKLIKERAKKKPIAYLLNKKFFWNSEFYVNKNTLIPRPDTEVIIEEVLRLTKNNTVSLRKLVLFETVSTSYAPSELFVSTTR